LERISQVANTGLASGTEEVASAIYRQSLLAPGLKAI
jgi:hypothetical protein